MAFLNPLILFGLAAASIPLIIHLFNFRRPRRVDFSSLAFLKELQKTTMQRVRIKQWLLLLLRTLAIACVVLAFARPTLQGGLAGTLGGRASSSVAVIVDNSLSMTLRDAEGAYLAQARDVAAALVDRLEPGDEVFVLTTADDPAVTPAPYQNQGPAQDAIAAVEARAGAMQTSRLLARASVLLEDAANLNREVFLLSDLQRSTLTDSQRVDMPDDIRTRILPIGERSYDNVAVTDVRIGSRIIEMGQPVRIEATLVNYSGTELTDYVASIVLEGERVAQATADLAPGAPTTVAFSASPQQRGWLAGVVQIEDDAFEYDNQRHFALHVPERRKVLAVRGDGQPIEYVELALSPELSQGRVAFDLETIGEGALAATGLGAFDAVMLVGARTLSSGEVAALSRYIRQGGGLLFFPSEGAAAGDYNALFDSLGAGQFSGYSGAPGSGRPIAGFDRVDLEHTLFDGVFGQRGGTRAPQVESPSIYHAMNYSPGSGNEQTLIRLSNGFPFMQEVRHGRGVALLMAVAPAPAWSDLPVRGLFIPLLYRSMYYLSSSEAVSGEQLMVGQPGELRLAGVSETGGLQLVAPDGTEFTPEQRSLFGALLVQVDAAALSEPGIYDVWAGEELIRRVAVNLDSRESDLSTYAGDEAATRLEEVLGTEVSVLAPTAGDANELVRAIEQERMGVELWNVFLMLALAFLVAEMLVARQWRPETAAAAA